MCCESLSICRLSCTHVLIQSFMALCPTKFRQRMFKVFDRICFKICRKSRPQSGNSKNKRMSTSISNSNSILKSSRITRESTYTFSSFGNSLSSPHTNRDISSQTSFFWSIPICILVIEFNIVYNCTMLASKIIHIYYHQLYFYHNNCRITSIVYFTIETSKCLYPLKSLYVFISIQLH